MHTKRHKNLNRKKSLKAVGGIGNDAHIERKRTRKRKL
jgi:hypothetical protein